MTPAIEALVRAWTDPGPVPEVHAAAQRRLWQTWPTLAGAIEDLVREAQR